VAGNESANIDLFALAGLSTEPLSAVLESGTDTVSDSVAAGSGGSPDAPGGQVAPAGGLVLDALDAANSIDQSESANPDLTTQSADDALPGLAANVALATQSVRELVDQVSRLGQETGAVMAEQNWAYWIIALGVMGVALEMYRRRSAVDWAMAANGRDASFSWFGGLGDSHVDDES
jgi:hypothetical protein